MNAILSMPVVLHEVRAGRPVAGDDVDDARRQLGLAADVREEQRRQRRRLGRLEHDRVPARERRRDLPREHQQREVPRDDLAGDAERARRAVRERVLELVGPARVVEEVRGREREVDVARLLDRLAAVERLERRRTRASAPGGCARCRKRYFARSEGASADQPFSNASRAAPTARSTSSSPACATSASGSSVDGRDRREPLARPRLDPLAADEEPVALAELDDVARLGRGRVLPLERSQGGSRRASRPGPSVDREVVPDW